MVDKEAEKNQEIQNLGQALQSILMQKQSFQMELNEAESALKELEKSGEEVFKIIGQLMVKTNKSDAEKELLEKQKMIQSRLESLENQEKVFSEKMEKYRKESMGA